MHLNFIRPLDSGFTGPFVGDVALADFNADGRLDLLVLAADYPLDGATFASHRPRSGRLYLGQTDGRWEAAPEAAYPAPRTVHPRKVLVGDFNADNKPDVFVADHGWDADPFPGQPNTLLLSTANGWNDASASLPRIPDYTHTAAMGDIDRDGDIDIFVGNGYNIRRSAQTQPYLLINDGRGQFARDDSRVPVGLGDALDTVTPGLANNFPGATMADADGDGWVDLIVTGDATRDFNTFRQTTVFWNTGGRYDSTHITRLSEPANPSAHIDLDAAVADFNGDGIADILVAGTNGQPFYDGSFFQLHQGLGQRQFRDVSSTALPTDVRSTARDGVSTGKPWPKFLHVIDYNRDGAPDVAVEYWWNVDAHTPVILINDGTGRFEPLKVADLWPQQQDLWAFQVTMPVQTPSGVDYITPQIYPGSGGLQLAHLQSTEPYFGRPSDRGPEALVGTAHTNWFVGGLGDDQIDGGAGIDWATYRYARTDYRLQVESAGSWRVIAQRGNEGSDTLTHVERLRFQDVGLALDIEGHAGQVAKIIGTVFGPTAVRDAALVATGLRLLDSGVSARDLLVGATAYRLGTLDPSAVVDLLYGNLLDRPPTPGEAAFWIDHLSGEPSALANLLEAVADSSLNAQRIDLVGLSQTGLPFAMY